MLAPTRTAVSSALELRPYQFEAADAVRGGFRRGLRRMLVQLATGLGKTVLFAHLAHRVVQRGGRVLVIAHRDELLTQAREKLLVADPDADVGIVRAEQNETGAAIVVASIQTLARPNRLARVGRFGMIVVDEAHHAAAASYRDTLDALGAFEPGGPVVLGVTATPGRGDGVGLDSVFQEIVYRMGILDGIRGGYLCDLRAVGVALETDFADVHARGGDLADGELGDALMAADAPEHVRDAYLDHADGRRAIVFTPTVDVARSMAEVLADAGVPSAWVSGSTPRAERAEILEALRAGSLRVVANCAVLTEGFDCPPVDCIITARPTKSTALYTQMIGRGTRPYPGKRDCLILDVVGQAGRHDLVTVAGLFGLSPRELAGRSVTQALNERERVEEQQRGTDGGRLVVRPVELFAARSLHWVEQAPGRYVLTISDGRITLTQHRQGWAVAIARYGGAPLEIARDLPLEYAQGIAEDRARRMGGSRLADPNAAWRRRPASVRQLDTLRRWGVLGARASLTAGEASDMISAGKRRAS
jgi:ATP-dependent helicase IRC3